jgi:hypothetical protein
MLGEPTYEYVPGQGWVVQTVPTGIATYCVIIL